jgi:hypothetical protein
MATPTEAGAAIALTAERRGARFAQELARILRVAERRLRPVLADALAGDITATVRAARGVALRAQIRQVLTEAGYDDLVQEASVSAVEAMADQVMQSRTAQGVARLTRPSAARLQALAVLGETNLLGVADDAAAALTRAVGFWAFTVSPAPVMIETLAAGLEQSLSEAQTLFDTQVSIYGRQIEAIGAESLGPDQPFLYTGPVDGRTREWCLQRVGKVYTRREIEAMDNGQLPNPFLTGGGYNCRHSFLAVSSDELRSLVGTETRAPGFEAEIAGARAQRRQARRADRQRRAA